MRCFIMFSSRASSPVHTQKHRRFLTSWRCTLFSRRTESVTSPLRSSSLKCSGRCTGESTELQIHQRPPRISLYAQICAESETREFGFFTGLRRRRSAPRRWRRYLGMHRETMHWLPLFGGARKERKPNERYVIPSISSY